VEVGRALAASPRVVLLDEPFSGLDTAGADRLAEVLDRVKATERVSFLLVDHSVETVLAQSRIVVALDAGRVIGVGTPAEIRQNELVRASYLGKGIEEHTLGA
jgi:ABC-type branched-subunit amino acid transport system ATPase component